MPVALCIPTLNAFDNLIECINSARTGAIVPDRIFIWDNSGGKFNQFLDIKHPDFDRNNIFVVESPTNIGCSRAWNTMIAAQPEMICVVSNDDIVFHVDTIKLLVESVERDSLREHIIHCAGGMPSPNAFSLFATDSYRMSRVGWFDEFFLYPYCEDSCMYRRIRAMGDDLVRVEGCGADHAGSQTLENYDNSDLTKHHVWFNRNVEYYKLKYGITDHNNLEEAGYQYPFDNDPIMETLIKAYIEKKYGR